MLRPLAAVLSILAALPAQIGPAERAPLIGTVLDPEGQPVAGATVEVFREAGEGTAILDLEYSHSRIPLARTPTDRLGRFALQLPVGLPCDMLVDAPPFAFWQRLDVVPGEPLTVQLEPGAVFHGRVHLADTGAPAPASLRAFQADGPHPELGRTDAEGRFRFERLPSGTFTIEVSPDAAVAPHWQRVTFQQGEATGQDFPVAKGTVLTGRVTDAATGAPIANARIGENWTLRRAVRSGADGRFELRGFGARQNGELVCLAHGYVRAQVPIPDDLGEAHVHDFALDRGLRATGQVLAPDGTPAAGAYVALVGMVHEGGNHYFCWPATRTGPDGTFAVSGLRQDLAGTLLVRQPGWAPLVYHLPEPRDGVLRAGVIRLQKPQVVRGVVTGADGKPAARQKVALWGTNDDRSALAPDGVGPRAQGRGGWDLLKMYLGMREMRTDDHGAFAFGDVAPGDYQVVLYSERNERVIGVEVTVKAGADAAPLQLSR